MTDRIIEFKVPTGVSPGRADKIFAAEFADISRARLQKAFELQQVTFDGITIDKRFKINRAGVLRAVLEEPNLEDGPSAVEMDLDVIYEDEVIVVVNKQPGMVTHPGSGTGDDTLVHALLHHTKGQLSGVGAPERPGIVHRLDKETSGLIIVAKEDAAHHRIATAFSERETFKRYTALVVGCPKKIKGSCLDPIGRHRVHRTRMTVTPMGRPAHTDWQIEANYGGRAARISCIIHTGRTHQIRVHMSGMKHPLLGDATYGYKSNRLKEIEIPRVMLHSTELRLKHPVTEQEMIFEAPLPADFKAVMDALSE